MAGSTGSAATFGYAPETTQNTRVAPTTFLPFVQESIRLEQQKIVKRGLTGKRFSLTPVAGTSTVSGPILFEGQIQSIYDLLLLSLGSATNGGGAGPTYTDTITPGDLGSFSFQLGRPTTLGVLNRWDYSGAMINQLTLAQNAGELATLQAEVRAYREEVNQHAYVTPSFPSSIDDIAFSQLTVTVPDAPTYCFDSFTLNVNNNLRQTPKSCAADGGRMTVKPGTLREITGTLVGDHERTTDYLRAVAGTAGQVTIAYAIGSHSLTIQMDEVVFDVDTPNVSGPEEVKQSLPFTAHLPSGGTEADVITVTLVSDEDNS